MWANCFAQTVQLNQSVQNIDSYEKSLIKQFNLIKSDLFKLFDWFNQSDSSEQTDLSEQFYFISQF